MSARSLSRRRSRGRCGGCIGAGTAHKRGCPNAPAPLAIVSRVSKKMAARDEEYRKALGLSEADKLPGYERADRVQTRRGGPSVSRAQIRLKEAEKKKKKFSDLYVTYMASPEWRAKREEYFQKYGRQCKVTGCLNTAGDIHHHTYIRFTFEELTDLVGLCRFHHDEVHEFHKTESTKKRKMSLTRATEKVTGLRLK